VSFLFLLIRFVPEACPGLIRDSERLATSDERVEHYANIYSGSSLSKQEHTVINIGDPDGVPRLVSSPEVGKWRAIVSKLANVMPTRSPACDHHKASIGTQVC
jgi:hypothetical protein